MNSVKILSTQCKSVGVVVKNKLCIWNGLQRLDSWDQQFQNDKGVTDKDAAYTPALMDSGDCDLYPNDLVKNDWCSKKLDFVILFRTCMVVVVNKNNQAGYKGVIDLDGILKLANELNG